MFCYYYTIKTIKMQKKATITDINKMVRKRANGFGAEFGDCAPKVYSILREGAIGESKQNKKKKEEKPLGFSTLKKIEYEDAKRGHIAKQYILFFVCAYAQMRKPLSHSKGCHISL